MFIEFIFMINKEMIIELMMQIFIKKIMTPVTDAIKAIPYVDAAHVNICEVLVSKAVVVLSVRP
jgi:hypothetical protein